MASLNLGLLKTPITYWKPTEGEKVYLELESECNVTSMYILIGYGERLIFSLYARLNSGWNLINVFQGEGYYSWRKMDVWIATDGLMLKFHASFGKINEIVIVGDSGRRLNIINAQGEEGSENTVKNLIDEQEYFENPPTFLSEAYFDEVYFVRAANEYLELREPYENTHPPLGKLLIALGIGLFGNGPFGWRMLGVIFAALMIPLMYALGKLVFGGREAGTLAAFLLTFDFLHLALGRIGTTETFAVFFNTASIFFLYYGYRRLSTESAPDFKPIFLGVLFFSLAFSVKWYAIYGFIGNIMIFGLYFLRPILSKKASNVSYPIGRMILFFTLSLAFGVLVYFVTYVPHFIMGRGLSDIYLMQWDMYSYHAGLTTSHPFSSVWWMWPLDLGSLWLYFKQLPNESVSSITAIGNPLIWWFGLSSIILASWTCLNNRDEKLSYIVVIYLSQLLPYAFIPRCLFIYHYYINIPVMILALTWSITRTRIGANSRRMVLYLIAVVFVFAVFYPVISGFPIPNWYRELLIRWFRIWAF